MYRRRWERARKPFLRRYPLCRHCEDRGVVRPATVVDHIKPHRGDYKLFWDQSNWQGLCVECHNRKSVGERK